MVIPCKVISARIVYWLSLPAYTMPAAVMMDLVEADYQTALRRADPIFTPNKRA